MADEGEKEAFKTNVDNYIKLLREEQIISKSLSQLRASKRRLQEAMKDYMTTRAIESAEVKDVARLSRVKKRRILSLRRTQVESWAKELIGDDERSLQEVGRLYDAREVKEVEQLFVEPPE